MAVPTGLNHVAMSVLPGTLTDEWRAELLEFYERAPRLARKSSLSVFPIASRSRSGNTRM